MVLIICMCIFHENNGENSDESKVITSGVSSAILIPMRSLFFLALDKLGNGNIIIMFEMLVEFLVS